MKIIQGLDKEYFSQNHVVTVGTFDGVHLGHRRVLEEVISIKFNKISEYKSVVITFEPHPQFVLKNKHSGLKILTDLNEKLALLREIGIDLVFIVNFTEEFSKISAENFLKMLVNNVGISDLVVGYDHFFGRNREGGYEILQKFSEKLKFNVHLINEFTLNGEFIKSTNIRELIEKGQIEQANKFLGYYYFLQGEVIVGNRRGNSLGFPTSNIKPDSEFKLIPKNGVYFVRVTYNDFKYYGMMNIGNRPTFSDEGVTFMEVNIFNFNENIYGKKIKIEFIEYIRTEKKFDSTEKLIMQIKKDKDYCNQKIKKIKEI